MGGSVATRAVDRPVQFQDRASGFSLDAKLESARLFLPDAGGRQLVLVVWFDYWTFKRIDRGKLFGYTFESIDREGLESWELTSSLPVQMELRAEPSVLEPFADLAPDALLDRAVAAFDDPQSPLVDVASYRYLAVYQSKGAYLAGFTSVYKREK